MKVLLLLALVRFAVAENEVDLEDLNFMANQNGDAVSSAKVSALRTSPSFQHFGLY